MNGGTLTFSLDGIEAMAQAFRMIEDAVASDALASSVMQGAIVVMDEAKVRCPVDTGRLRNSIHPEYEDNNTRDKAVVDIGTDVEYAKFQEYGTGRRGATSDHPPLPEGYAHGPSAGIPAQPYLRPALDMKAEEAKRVIADALREQIRDAVQDIQARRASARLRRTK